MSRLIDADALTEDCKRYLGTLNPDRDGKECARIHWLIGVLENAPTIEPERMNVNLRVEKLSKHQSDFSDLDAQPERKGKWVWNENGMDWGLGAWVCSVCRSKPETWWESGKKNNPLRCSGSHFCPNCGARMEEGGEE